MSFKPYTEKLRRKNWNLGRIRIQNRTRIRIQHPGNGSADPDPHQNDTDPKHCIQHSAYFVKKVTLFIFKSL